jgi:hypothetical protein
VDGAVVAAGLSDRIIKTNHIVGALDVEQLPGPPFIRGDEPMV